MTEPDHHLNVRLTSATLEAYFSSRTVVVLSLTDTPPCTLRIDPAADRLALWTVATGPLPDLVALSRVTMKAEEADGVTWFVLTVDAREAHLEAYSLIAAVVDDLMAGLSLSAATSRSMLAYRDLLSARTRLSEPVVVGLVGELMVFEHLVDAIGPDGAAAVWLGPQSEEHDFVLDSFDVEVKTTLSERRQHVISTELQLQASPSRPLWLLSIQLTRAGGAGDGFTITDIVRRIKGKLEGAATVFDGHLERLGWHETEGDLYHERYVPRTHPQTYVVDEHFPAITRVRLDGSVPRPELVGPVTYRIDVTGLDGTPPPRPLDDFLNRED